MAAVCRHLTGTDALYIDPQARGTQRSARHVVALQGQPETVVPGTKVRRRRRHSDRHLRSCAFLRRPIGGELAASNHASSSALVTADSDTPIIVGAVNPLRAVCG